jgi:hypothetical protein
VHFLCVSLHLCVVENYRSHLLDGPDSWSACGIPVLECLLLVVHSKIGKSRFGFFSAVCLQFVSFRTLSCVFRAQY